MNVNVIELENGKSYIIFDVISTDGNDYVCLVNETDEKDITFRKILRENGKEYLVKLDSEEEFDKLIIAFYEEHTKKKEEIDNEE